jgi:signal transduction histidine kinase
MTALRDRVAGIDPRHLDVVLTLVFIIAIELECWLDRGISHRPLTAVAGALVAAPVAVRRSWPAGSLVFCCAVAAIQAPLGGHLGGMTGVAASTFVLAYSAGAWPELRRGLASLLLSAALLGASFALSGPQPSSVVATIGENWGFTSLLLAVPWFFGRLVHERTRRSAAFRELAAQAAAEQEASAFDSIAQERVRIGAELQDIIAHSVSAMIIQAGGARRLLRSDPDRARESIVNVEQTGREALADLRRLLGMLHKDEDPRTLAPTPGLGELATLVESSRDAGCECELHVLGDPIDLTPGISLLGYRLIEAALGNAGKHAGSRLVITVRYHPDRLELELRGDGGARDLEQDLIRVAERVALYDGSLRVLPLDGDRFALWAEVPLRAPVAV